MNKVFLFSDYRDFIRAKIAEAGNVKGYRSCLAKAAHCSPAFLSQILSSSVQLTPDQAGNLAVFWNMDNMEAEYFLLLVNYARAGSPNLRTLLKRQGRRLGLFVP